MSFEFGYLTPKQRRMWRMKFDGQTQSEISRDLSITRQSVNKSFNAVYSKITKALLEAAKVNRLDIQKLDPENGFLLGYSHALSTDVLITFSDENGLQTWYRREGPCAECDIVDSCRKKLLKEVQVRGISLPPETEEITPSQLADLLFQQIMAG